MSIKRKLKSTLIIDDPMDSDVKYILWKEEDNEAKVWIIINATKKQNTDMIMCSHWLASLEQA